MKPKKLNPAKNYKKILNSVMIVAGLVLLGTGVEWFDRMQAEKAYTRLAALRDEKIQAVSDPSLQSPLEPLLSHPVSLDHSAGPVLPNQETLPGIALPLSLNPNTPWLAINPDFAGWITISGTRIDYPYVRSKDNEEYLTKDFYGKASRSGTVFLDFRNAGGIGDQHLMLYGHNMKNGSMFHDLVKFHDEAFFNQNPQIILADLYTSRKYQIFSVYEISADDYMLPSEFDGTAAYSDFLKGLADRSMHPVQLMPDPDRRLLSLITCSYGVGNGRTILHALEIAP